MTRIVIVGGVAGGMSAAARARRLDEDAEIIVLERGEHVSFANCGLPYHVSGEIEDRERLLVQTPESLAASLRLDVRPWHDVVALQPHSRQLTVHTPAGEQQIGYDALILAPGARANTPPIPGLDSPRVQTLRTVDDAVAMRERIDAGISTAVVLGAGFIGLETAEALAHRGVRTTVVEFVDQVLPPLDPELATLVEEELSRCGVEVRTGVAAEQLENREHDDVVVLSDSTRIQADLVVLSVGVRPDTAVFEEAGIACERGAILVDAHGRTSIDSVWAVGDATASVDAVTGARRPVPLAGPANRAGRLVADAVLRPEVARPLPSPLGTAVVRVGELTAALTGANRRTLEEAGIDVETIHLHPLDHAGYFPGAEQVHLIVHFHRESGALLGAQAVGRSGVARRIDVLATAMRGGLRIDDLIDLDLAYAPPYGQAKDAVNLAGMLGANVLDQTVRLWHARDLDDVLQHAMVLDVRSRDEYAAVHLPDALNVPHTELRDRMDEVRDAAGGRAVRVMCASGVRSAIAHRVLIQAGVDSASLSGGMLTLRSALGQAAGDVLAGTEIR